MRSLREEAETGDLLAEVEVGAYWRKLRHELAGRKTAGMISGGGMLFGIGMHPDLQEMSCRDEFRRGNSS